MKIVYPDYSNNLVNLMNSIRRFYNLDLTNTTLKSADRILDKSKYNKIVLILLDGMGTKIIDKHLKDSSFFKTHKIQDLTSTFPSTTVAATTCVRSTYTPIETGYLGWHQYLKDIDKDLIVFNNKEYYTNNLFPFNPFKKDMPYKTLSKQLNEKGIDSVEIFPNLNEKNTIKCKSFNSFIRNILKYNKSKSFIYAYWGEPDSSLHKYGTDSKKITKILNRFDRKLNDDAADAVCISLFGLEYEETRSCILFNSSFLFDVRFLKP